MKINQYFKNNKWMPYAMAGCVTVLFYLLASHINYFFIGLRSFLGYISPVIIGLIMAYILDPLVKVFENNIFSGIKAKPGIKRLLSVWVTIILVLLTLVVFMFALVPQIVKSLGTFFANFDSYANSLQSILNSISLDAAENSVDISNITKILDTAIENLADYIQKNLGREWKTGDIILVDAVDGALTFTHGEGEVPALTERIHLEAPRARERWSTPAIPAPDGLASDAS